MACDICTKTGTPLVDLRDTYQTDEIKQICPACEKVVNDHLSKVLTVTHNILRDLVRRFIKQLREDQSHG